MEKPSEVRSTEADPPQCSIRSLFVLTTIIAAGLALWRLHFLVGLVVTLVALTAFALHAVFDYAKTHPERSQTADYLALAILGVFPPSLITLSFAPLGSLVEVVACVAKVAAIGIGAAIALAGYLLLFGRILEMIFGRRS